MPATPAEQADRATTPILGPEERRWLHDKYERLASEEAQLASSRTSYYAAIGTVLVTGLLVAVVDLGGVQWVLAAAVTFLALLGILISSVWAVLLHRTNDALRLWREAAFQIETRTPPLSGQLIVPVPLRSGASVDVDVLRPYTSHRQRFSPANHISWIDKVDPDKLTEVLPMTFLGLWSAALLFTWTWFFFLR